MKQSQHILKLASRQRLVRAADVRALGYSAQLLLKLHAAGQLERVARGLYALPGAEPGEHQTLMEVCQRVPKAVVCLLSALQFHGLGSEQPHEVWIALPEGAQTPALGYPPLRVARLREPAYSEGMEMVMVNGVPIRVYGVAKTVVDCFKFRHKIGLDVALEALKDAWRKRRLTVAELSHFARINRVEKVIRPYMEALVA